MSSSPRTAPIVRWDVAVVDGKRVEYMECGAGDPLVFLHGWGLTPRTYGAAITGLTSAGVRLISPCLPGFGGSSALPLGAMTMADYAARVAGLLEVIGIDRPSFVMGHSFGGGVALRLASDRPDLVRSLTLINSVGGSPAPPTDAPPTGRFVAMTSRPWWRWALALVAEADPRYALQLRPADLRRLVSGVVRDFVPNALRRPLPMVRSALLALEADLAVEAQSLIDGGLPVLFVWGDRDRLITPGAFSAIQGEMSPEIVRGRHGWLLTSPEEFTALLRNALVVHAMLERQRRGQAVSLPAGMSLADFIPAERRHRSRSGSPADRRTAPPA